MLPEEVAAGDERQVTELVGKLLEVADDHRLPISRLARAVNIDPSTVSRWRSGAEPKLLHVMALAYAVDLRMEWEPGDPEWPGSHLPPASNPPAPEDWWCNAQWRGVGVAIDREISWRFLVYEASLLGAEARWARQRMGWSLEQCPGSRHAWADLENGPSLLHTHLTHASRTKRREYRSSPLRTAAFVGRHLGLSLAWNPLGDPWRIRPWQVPAESLKAADTHGGDV